MTLTCFQAPICQPAASDATSLPAGTAARAAVCWYERYDSAHYQSHHERLTADYPASRSLRRS